MGSGRSFLGFAELHGSVLSESCVGRECEDVASSLLIPSVILPPKEKVALEGSPGEEGNRKETAKKVLGKAAGMSG